MSVLFYVENKTGVRKDALGRFVVGGGGGLGDGLDGFTRPRVVGIRYNRFIYAKARDMTRRASAVMYLFSIYRMCP